MNVPEKLEAGSYNIELVVECEEFSNSTSFIAEIIPRKLKVEIVDVKRVSKDSLKIIYSLEELSGHEQSIDIQILFLGENAEKISEKKETREIRANSKKEFESLLKIYPSLRGSFKLLVNANSELASSFAEEDVILKQPTLGGLAILSQEKNKSILSSIILLLIFVIFSLLILRKIMKYKKLYKIKTLKTNVTSLPNEEKRY